MLPFSQPVASHPDVKFILSLATITVAALDLADIRDWMIGFGEWSSQQGFLGILAYVVALTLVTILCVPCSPLVLAGGAVYGPVVGSFAVLAGLALGASGGFLIARYVARSPLERRIQDNPRFTMIDTAIGLEGWKIVGLLRLCPLPFGISNYAYGLTSITFWHYLGATLVGILPSTIMFVYMGALGMESLEAMAEGKESGRGVLEYVMMALMLVAGIAALTIIGRIVKRAIQTKIGEAEAA